MSNKMGHRRQLDAVLKAAFEGAPPNQQTQRAHCGTAIPRYSHLSYTPTTLTDYINVTPCVKFRYWQVLYISVHDRYVSL